MAIDYNGHLPALRDAFRKGKMTFYLGAGVSKDSGIPTWEAFVQALYFSTLKDESYIYSLRPYPNYLFALAEWVFSQKREPLEIITRKMKVWYGSSDFIKRMEETLYATLYEVRNTHGSSSVADFVLEVNPTLKAVVQCCRKSLHGQTGLKSIVTYNYDSLVELGLSKFPEGNRFEPVYRQGQSVNHSKIPIYHVHGYIPFEVDRVRYEDIIFSEDQYNRAFQDVTFWGNVVQMGSFTNSTGLMIGLSLSDRNTRRILDSIASQPMPRDNYIIMQKPRFKNLDDRSPEIQRIKEKAQEYQERFRGRLKEEHKEVRQIQAILDRIYQYEQSEFIQGFESLGLRLITVDEYSEIPTALSDISG